MSTYLVAILISDYKCRQGEAHPTRIRTVNVSVCARANAQDELDVALEASVKMSEFFEKYYGIRFPLEKLGKSAFKSWANWKSKQKKLKS
jgi:aminopeptidase N